MLFCFIFRANASNGTSDLSKKRQDYLEWPEYFMAIAFLSAQRSKDPISQVIICTSRRMAVHLMLYSVP